VILGCWALFVLWSLVNCVSVRGCNQPIGLLVRTIYPYLGGLLLGLILPKRFLHRWVGKISYITFTVVVLAVLAFSAYFSIWDPSEFDSYFLFLGKQYNADIFDNFGFVCFVVGSVGIGLYSIAFIRQKMNRLKFSWKR
jgi:hypothetical protein